MRLPGVPPYNAKKNTKFENKIKTRQNRPCELRLSGVPRIMAKYI